MNNITFSRLLIKEGINVNKKDKLGRSPLTISCYFGFYDLAKLLLENSAVVNDTCFKKAQKGWDGHSQIEILELLREHEK